MVVWKAAVRVCNTIKPLPKGFLQFDRFFADCGGAGFVLVFFGIIV
jgi:hypothetical protein